MLGKIVWTESGKRYHFTDNVTMYSNSRMAEFGILTEEEVPEELLPKLEPKPGHMPGDVIQRYGSEFIVTEAIVIMEGRYWLYQCEGADGEPLFFHE